jgi:segregation and condensation protein B
MEQPGLLDTELDHLPPELRWREWMGRVEAVIFAASDAGDPRDAGARRRQTLQHRPDYRRHSRRTRGRPYELVSVAGGWQHRTKKAFGDVIRTAAWQGDCFACPLSQSEALVLMCIAYFQPITRGELSSFFGKEVSRDLIGGICAVAGFDRFGTAFAPAGRALYLCDDKGVFVSLRVSTRCAICRISRHSKTPGYLSKEKLLAGDIPVGLASGEGHEELDIVASEDP